MKRTVTYVTTLLLLLSTLVGCGEKMPAEDVAPPQSNETVYLARIAELETALQKEKEDRFVSDATYEATIKELQSKLETLEGADREEQDTATGELVFRYKLENGKAVITGFSGSSNLVSIPALLDGHPVIAIGERAFEGHRITAVVLPEGLEVIGWFAFYGCEGLMDVSIPDSVTSIGYAVFDGCPNVTLICNKDSYAAQYAASYGLPCIFAP